MKTLTIQLFGQAYKVRCPEGEERVLETTECMLNKKIKETQRNSGLSCREDIIMMTALNLCHEEVERELEQKEKDSALQSSQAAAILRNNPRDPKK